MLVRTQNKNHSKMVSRMQTRTKKGAAMSSHNESYAKLQQIKEWILTRYDRLEQHQNERDAFPPFSDGYFSGVEDTLESLEELIGDDEDVA